MSIDDTFKRYGLHPCSGSTKLEAYTVAEYKSFFAEQTTNRNSAGWKVAEYIYVDISGREQNISKLLKNWVALTRKDTFPESPQKLIVEKNNHL